MFWLRILERRIDGALIVENVTDRAKREVPNVRAAIEPNLVFPILRGRDIARWLANLSVYLLQVQDPNKRRGFDEDWLKQELPLTYDYLRRFESILRERSGFKKFFCNDSDPSQAKAPFYTIYNVGTYTLSDFKVLWSRVANEIDAAVVAPKSDSYVGERVQIPYECMAISLDSKSEAHYLCGLINSAPARLAIKSYIVLHPDAHVLEHVRLPQYEPTDNRHERLARLSEQAHELVRQDSEKSQEALKHIEKEIDEAAAELWNISGTELRDIQSSLADLR